MGGFLRSFTLSYSAHRPRVPLSEVDLDPLSDLATGEIVGPSDLD